MKKDEIKFRYDPSLAVIEDVEFGIQIRNDKQVAVDVRCLLPGSVVFEHESTNRFNGIVMRIVSRNLLTQETFLSILWKRCSKANIYLCVEYFLLLLLFFCLLESSEWL